jgi:tetratricopeptide (TPR) repeat protein
MADDLEGFQRGLESRAGGLNFQVPEQARATLKINTNVDLGKLGAFGAQKIDIKSVADQIQSPGTGLQTNLDIGSLGESVKKIKMRQKSDRLQALLDKAQQLMENREYRKALTPIDKALGIEPGVPPILVVKAYALLGLEDYPAAVKVLREARQNAPDSETQILTIFMEAACARAITKKIEAQLGEHLKAKKFSEALAYVESQIRAYPENPVLPYQRSRLLMLLNRYGEAKAVAQETMRRVPTMRAVCEEALAEIAVAENIKYLDAARRSLRRNDPVGAMEHLNQCRAVLGGTEQFEAIRSYADSTLPRGFFSSVFRKDRPAQLDEDTLQRVLMWLLAEELEAGTKALADGKYTTAIQLFEDSYRIDARCHVIDYLHAVAIVKELERLLAAKQQVDAEEWTQKMKAADVSLASASQDERMADQCRSLAAVVKQYKDLLGQAARVQSEIRPINKLYDEFNSFMNGLTIKSTSDLAHAEKKLKDMRGRTHACLGRTRDANGRKHLQELATVIDRHLGEIADARKQVPARPSARDLSSGSPAQQCFAVAVNVLQQIDQQGYVSYDEKQQNRNLVKALRGRVQSIRKDYTTSEDDHVLDATEQVLNMIEQKL